MFKYKKILITGGTGSWGHELTRQLLKKNPEEIRIISRGEYAQVKMKRKFQDERINFRICNVRDYSAMDASCKEIDYMFHLAALKHVPICEEQPYEAIKTNIQGTKNIIKAAINNKIKKVIDVSTDKAVDPINLYGLTKATGERLIIQANKISNKPKFMCIRAGNVLGTNGSVVPFFIKSIKESNEITITDRRMTRFFITLEEAIELLFTAAEKSIGGETFVERMCSFRLMDLAEILIEHYGDEETEIKEIGARPGEKLHEVLVSRYEIDKTYEYDDKYFLILPLLFIKGLSKHYKDMDLEKVKIKEFTSRTELSTKSILKRKLQIGGFLD
mgnify:FL=1